MFEVVALSSGFANKRLWSTCAGITAEALLLACAALAPLVSPQALPHSRAIMAWLLPMTPPPPPAAGDAVKPRPARPSPERLQTVPGRLTAPASIPPKAAIIVDEPLETSGYGVPGGVYTGERDGVPGGFLSVLQDAAPPAPAVQTPPAPVAAPIPIAPQQVPVGGQVKMARLIYRVEPLYPPLAPAETNYLILKPNIGVGTAEVFKDPDLTRNSAPITIHGFLASGGRNDCLGVVRRRYPEVAHALDWLSGFGSARLTGTGACVFLAVESMDRGREILGRLPPGLDAFLARGLNDSPLLERLAAG